MAESGQQSGCPLRPMQMRLTLYPSISPGQAELPAGHRLGELDPAHSERGSPKCSRALSRRRPSAIWA